MYNGIGLSSVRGTATSGHVQANRGHVRGQRKRRQLEQNVSRGRPQAYNPVSASARERGNSQIQKHERLRQVESRVMELRERLEENGRISPEEIERRVKEERERQLRRIEEEEKRNNSNICRLGHLKYFLKDF